MKPGIEPAWPARDPVAIAADKPQAEPVARQPALVLGDHLHGAHLLGARLREDRLVGIGEERAPAAEIADRPPQLPGRGPRAGLDVDRLPDAVGVRLRDVALRRRGLRLEASRASGRPARTGARGRSPCTATPETRSTTMPEQREREVGVVEAGAGRAAPSRPGRASRAARPAARSAASATSRRASRAAGPTRARGAGGSTACTRRPRRAGRACPRDRACRRRGAA